MGIKVNLTKHINIDGKKRYAPVVQGANGRVRPDIVLVDGRETHITTGVFYLDWTEGGKRRRLSVGSSAANAVARRLRKQAELNAAEQGIEMVPEKTDERKRLTSAISAYLEEIRISKKHKTLLAYTTALSYFQEACNKMFIEDIERGDLVKFHGFLRDKKKQSPRSCWNKFSNVMGFLKAHGVIKLVKPTDWPRYVEEEPEVYEKDELTKFFSFCDEEERAWFEFFLMTGMREQEVSHCSWVNVNLNHGTVHMRWKNEYGWTPKAYKEREIPVPAKLIATLATFKPPELRKGLLFPTSNGRPKGDFLDCCKTVAKRAGLDTEQWWLHKFRATFATWHLHAGVDLRTVQKWLGHVDMESTMRYLRAARGAEVQEKVNATFA